MSDSGSSRPASAECVFCRISRGEIPATVVHEDEDLLVFEDLNPQAPTHLLIIPRAHIASVDDLRDDERELAGGLFLAARDVARSRGVAEDGYRLVVNTGRDGGQTVDHLHVHLLAGRPLSWPPG